MKDVYGADYDLDMSTDYLVKVDTFQDGVAKIKNDGVLCSYKNNKENFIFDLAQEIVEKSLACKLYLQAKYFKKAVYRRIKKTGGLTKAILVS